MSRSLLHHLSNLAGLALLCCGCAYGSLPYGSERPIQEDVVVRGRVVDAETGDGLEGVRVTARAVNPPGPVASGEPAGPDGRFHLLMELWIGIRGRSPLAGIPTDPLPPRYPVSTLRVEDREGRFTEIEHPSGRWRRIREGGPMDGRLVYDVGTIRFDAPTMGRTR